MNDAGQFYTNRVLKEWKEKDITHVNWAKAWIQTLTELQQYIKQYHTTGIVWAGKGKATLNGNTSSAPPPPPPGGKLFLILKSYALQLTMPIDLF
jgi:adenylyl cyclase-associated protein